MAGANAVRPDATANALPYVADEGRKNVSVYEQELKRIESKLKEFLPRQVAREIVARIYTLARDADEEIERILQDPVIARLYEYDGRLFTARDSFEFHQAFSGLNAL